MFNYLCKSQIGLGVMKLSFYPFRPYSTLKTGKIFKKSCFNFGRFVNQSSYPSLSVSVMQNNLFLLLFFAKFSPR